jgi:hypothetical protein
MALELQTDGATEISTTGDVDTSTTGATTDYKLGTTNTTTIGAVYGFCTFMFGVYTGFVNAVTGVSIDMKLGASISLFYGYRCVVQGGACTTVSAIQETNVKANVMKKITNLQEMLSSQTQIIDTDTKTITNLTQKVDKKISNYDVEEKNGDTSTEAWTTSKSITTGSYELDCKEALDIGVNKKGLRVDTGGTYINGTIIELA